MARGNQLDRQWRLLQLIDRPAGVTVEDAARALDCHVRTIWRDVNVLAGAGFPIYDDKAGDRNRTVWRVTDEFRPDPEVARSAGRAARADASGGRHPGGAAVDPGLG